MGQITGKIQDIGTRTTTAGTAYDVQINGIKYSTFDNPGVVGRNVTFEEVIKVGNNGKEYHNVKRESMRDAQGGDVHTPTTGAPNSAEPNLGDRIMRQNSNGHAVALVAAWMATSDGQPDLDVIVKLTKGIAKSIFDWTKNGYDPAKPAVPVDDSPY